MLRKRGDEFPITIDNQLLKESREEGLFLRKERFMATAPGRLCKFTHRQDLPAHIRRRGTVG